MSSVSKRDALLDALKIQIRTNEASCVLIDDWLRVEASSALEGKFVLGVNGEQVLIALCRGTAMYHSQVLFSAWEEIFDEPIVLSPSPETPSIVRGAVVQGALFSLTSRGGEFEVSITGKSGTFGALRDDIFTEPTSKVVADFIVTLAKKCSAH